MTILNWLKRDFIKRVCNKRGAWYAIAGWAIAGIATWASTSSYSSGQAAKHEKGVQEDITAQAKRDREKLLEAQKPPVPEDAKAKAKQEADKQKRIRSLAGGKTILSQQGPALSSTTTSKSLLGS